PDVVCMEIEHADEAQLQSEPKDLDDDPKQEVAFENHFARHGILPERDVDGEVAAQDARSRPARIADFGLSWLGHCRLQSRSFKTAAITPRSSLRPRKRMFRTESIYNQRTYRVILKLGASVEKLQLDEE